MMSTVDHSLPDDPPRNEEEFLRRQSQTAKNALNNLRGEVWESMGRTVDVGAWTARFPWPALGTAAVAGVAGGWALGKTFRRSPRQPVESDSAGSAEQSADEAKQAARAARSAQAAAEAARPASRLVSGLGTLVGALASAAATAAAESLGEFVKETMHDTLHPNATATEEDEPLPDDDAADDDDASSDDANRAGDGA